MSSHNESTLYPPLPDFLSVQDDDGCGGHGGAGDDPTQPLLGTVISPITLRRVR